MGSQVAMPTHISVPALQCSGNLGSEHCAVSRASASYTVFVTLRG